MPQISSLCVNTSNNWVDPNGLTISSDHTTHYNDKISRWERVWTVKRRIKWHVQLHFHWWLVTLVPVDLGQPHFKLDLIILISLWDQVNSSILDQNQNYQHFPPIQRIHHSHITGNLRFSGYYATCLMLFAQSGFVVAMSPSRPQLWITGSQYTHWTCKRGRKRHLKDKALVKSYSWLAS